MRVRLYVGGFNLDYGAKRLVTLHSSSSPRSCRWLDPRALAAKIVAQRWAGRNATIEHVTYCTARIIGGGDAAARHAAYLRALEISGSVDLIEYGLFKERYKELPRAIRGADGRPLLPGGSFQLVGVSIREEKGSDVNLASHLLIDALSGTMDAAIIISNDSDLELPVRETRTRMPVGTISPQGRVHGSLRAQRVLGSGHWYHTLDLSDLVASQLPNPCHGIQRPPGW